MAELKSIEQHYRDVMGMGAAIPAKSVPLWEADTLVLAEDVQARYAIPPFTNSAMDGFAVRAADVVPGHTVALQADVPAGSTSSLELRPGTAIRIMTGAPLPAGADAVLTVENTEGGQSANMQPELPAAIVPTARVNVGENVRSAGEDVAPGDCVFSAGTVLSGAHIGALAALGYGAVRVHPRVNVGVLATGSELTEPGVSLCSGHIPDSNSYMVAAMLAEHGAVPDRRGEYSDSVGRFLDVFDDLVHSNDCVITTGGVSAGAFDVVKAALRERGLHFEKVKMQPGKPQGWGLVDGKPVLCLPGNPVSVFVSMQLFGLPLLDILQGKEPHSFESLFAWAVAGTDWKHKLGRTQFLPAVLGDDGVLPASRGGSGSHLIGSLPQAELLAVTPADQEWMRAGDAVRVLWL
ncbi:MAG: molybdopterin molybdotransferase MoeA [Actinomycetaceae bacterium]|nr:molybdopterin molybdotransferase MoeA [Arcanobacterium sp.]MDD7687027.1 molybdopterin molybdotransferase MoeA [Actinomycetaceae bacterium]MDY5273316.1 molybdopterin molybdotransferase MoeA [Arcanobacterium sp.]